MSEERPFSEELERAITHSLHEMYKRIGCGLFDDDYDYKYGKLVGHPRREEFDERAGA